MVRVYRYILSFCLPVLAVCPASANDYSDCTVLSHSASNVSFVYRPAAFSWAGDGNSAYAKIANTALDSREGLPPIVGRIVYVAIPPGTTFVDAEVTSLGSLERMTPPQPGATQLTLASYPYPDSRVRYDGISVLQGVRMARLVLHPATVVGPDGTVELVHEMTVSVRMEGKADVSTAAPSRRGPFATVLDQILINPDDARVSNQSTLAKVTTDVNPFASGSQWVSIRTRGDGAHIVSADALRLAGINIATVNPAQIRLFAGPGRQLSTKVTDPPPPLREAAIFWQGDDDNVMEEGENFVFWADALNRWEVDSVGNLVDVVNRYDRDNVYWLAISYTDSQAPLRMSSVPAPPQEGATDLFTGIERARHEEENEFRVASSGFIESYYTRYWRNQQHSVISFFNVRNPEIGMPATLDMGTWAGFAADYPPQLSANGATLLPNVVRERQGEDRSTLSTFELASFNPGIDYELQFDSSGASSNYLDFYTLEYNRRLDLAQGPLKFAAPDTTLEANFVIANAAAARLWDITDSQRPLQIDIAEREGTTLRFGVSLTKGSRRVFAVFSDLSLRVPRSISQVALVNLHSPATSSDYLAIGPRAFANSMNDFLAYRTGTDALQTRYVAIEDVYNSFSLGLQDPLAIRRFLKHTHTDWPGEKPTYCLLVGDGTNDFLNETGANSVNYVPPYIAADEPAVSDESYIYFSDRAVLDAEGNTADNPIPDMLIGRWPVRSTAEVSAITAKVKRYESAENLGPWRSRFMMVADDEFGERPGSVREEFHTRDAEDIATTLIPPRFDVQKIYLTEYPFENPSCYEPDATGCRKPAAKEAVIAGLNAGALVCDYLGHGNPDVLAHERIFERQTDLSRLVNAETPTALLTFSCSIGFFDDPEDEGMSEELFRMPQGGAVAVVSATRIAAALANAEFNSVVIDLMFKRGVTGIATAVFTSKLIRQYFDSNCRLFEQCEIPPCPCGNDRGYVLFGDPAMHLGAPTLRVNFASINPDSLSALSPTQVTGMITDTAGALQSSFNGTLFVTVRDVARQRVYQINEDVSVDYELAGGTLYRGQVAVSNGQFNFTFIVPKDIAYGQTGAVIMGHAVSATSMANGAADSLRLAGSPNTISDTAGPTVRLETDKGEVIADGFFLPENSVVTVLINDPSGINMTGSAGHRLEVFADGSETPLTDLTDDFVYDAGAADRGHASFSVTGLPQGQHRITVKAWDNANNSTETGRDVELVAAEANIGFSLTEFLNHPNPCAGETTFYFRATRAVREAHIRLFTLAGRMVWEAHAEDGVTTWDGRDSAGDQVANGVYLAQLEAVGEELSEGGQSVDKKAYREMKVVVSR